MSEHIHRSHNVPVLLYHLMGPAKYRRKVFSAEGDKVLREAGLKMAPRHELTCLEIGTDRDHVHFVVQAIPTYSRTKIVRVIKSLTTREIFRRVPAVKKCLRGGEFWSDAYYISTVGRHSSEGKIQRDVAVQGRRREYSKLHPQQLPLF